MKGADSTSWPPFYQLHLLSETAYNYRTDFLGLVFNGPSNEPVHYDAYGTLDFSFSYNFTEEISAFVEGINITGETVEKYGRHENQFMGYEDTGSLYTFGLRANF